MYNKTIKQMSEALQSKQYSSVELTHAFLQRIKNIDKSLNSYITVSEEYALDAAAKADILLQKGEGGTLTGIPIAQKDIFCTKGIKTTCGSKMLDNFIAPYDATLIEKCNAAGMVMLGKTNMDEFAMGSSNENSYYGPVMNPWATDCVPGGSSGGSGAAVAARIAPIATGTDTGGSIRQPAALCGITGIKPTYGRVSRYGMIAFASSLDQGGPMAQTAEDAALLLNVICGFDEKDSTSAEVETPDFTAHLNNDLKGCRIGLAKEFFNQDLDPKIAELTDACAKQCEKMGAELVEVSLPNLHLSLPTYYIIAPAECSSNLARYDGVRYGYRCENPKDLLDMYERTRSEGFGAEVKRRIMIGTYALSAGYYDAYYIKAQKIRRLISSDFKAAFEKVDVLLSPTTPSPSFKMGEKSNDPIAMYLSDIYTLAVNLAGLPGLSMPAGFCENKPIGVQLIGNYFDESKILNVAHRYQQETDWHTQLPPIALGE